MFKLNLTIVLSLYKVVTGAVIIVVASGGTALVGAAGGALARGTVLA